MLDPKRLRSEIEELATQLAKKKFALYDSIISPEVTKEVLQS